MIVSALAVDLYFDLLVGAAAAQGAAGEVCGSRFCPSIDPRMNGNCIRH
jgi:hypothetical protein